MDKLERLLAKYQDQFEDNFPLMLCRHMDDDEIATIIENCLDADEPYEPKLDVNANY